VKSSRDRRVFPIDDVVDSDMSLIKGHKRESRLKAYAASLLVSADRGFFHPPQAVTPAAAGG